MGSVAGLFRPSSSASRRRLTGVLAVLALVIAGLVVPGALADGQDGADGVVGSFEIDGNRADDSGPGEPIDWDTPPPNLIHFEDEFNSQTDNSFGQGSKELEPGEWVCTQGGVPGKDDIVRGDLAIRTLGGEQFIYADWERFKANGDAHIDYEFNQSSEPNPNCAGDPNPPPQRTDGDLLVTFDTERGGKEIIVRAFEWEFTGPGVGVFNELSVGAKHDTWDAAVNIPPEKSPPDLDPGAFGELALNLTDTIGTLPCGPDHALQAHMKTRASTSINAALKDRTDPQTFTVPCDFAVTKTVDPTTAQVGDTVQVTITVTNVGTAPGSTTVTDDYDEGHVVVSNINPEPESHDETNGVIVWQSDTLEPGESQEFTYDATITGPFTSDDPQGTDACEPNEFPVINTVTVVDDTDGDTDDEDSAVVCVIANPDLFVNKAADGTSFEVGDLVTYTIGFGNAEDADAVATDVVITDEIPDGTEFDSCTGTDGTEDDCTVEGDTVTWQVGDLDPGETGSVTLTLEIVSIPDLVTCEICNTATIASAVEDADPTDDTSTTCVAVDPAPDPSGANAHDSAFGAHVQVDLLGVDETLAPVSSSQSGIGADSENDELETVEVPGVTEIGLLRTTSTSTISGSPGANATHTSTAQAVDVDLLGGLVTADLVRAVATATATGSSASFNATGSTIQNLVIDGEKIDDIAPNTRVDLPAELFGAGSYVAVFEQCTPQPDGGVCTGVDGSVTTPDPGQRDGGTYAAALEVNMLRVHVTDLIGTGAVEVVVSNAVANADFPQTTICGELPPTQAVSGDALIASAQTDPSVASVTVGYVEIPHTGGSDHQNLAQAEVPGALSTGTAVSDTTGALSDTTSTASSFAQVQDVCLAPDGAGGCAVAVDLVRSESNSAADADGASSNDGDGDGDGDTVLVGLEVMGTPMVFSPDPNTVVDIPGLGFLILNEQFCDDGAELTGGCADGAGHAGLTVRALRLVILDPQAGGDPGAEVIVAQAHSDATFVP